MTRPARLTRRRWLIVGLVSAGGLVAWGRRDPRPARLVIPPGGSPDQTWFAGDGRTFVALGPEPAYWDLTAGRRVGSTGLDPTIRWRATAPDGRSCLGYLPPIGGATPEVVWVDVTTRAIKLRLPTTLASPIGPHLAFRDGGRAIRAMSLVADDTVRTVTWDVATGRATTTSIRRPEGMMDHGRYAVAAGLVACRAEGADGVRLGDVIADRPAGAPLVIPGRHHEPGTTAHFTPDERTLIVAHPGGMIDSWDVATRRLLRSVRFPGGATNPVSWEFAPDGRTILAQVDQPPAAPSRFDPAWRFAEDHLGEWAPEWFEPRYEAVVLDLATGRRLARLRSTAYLGEFSPDGRWIIGEEPDGKLSVRAAPQPPAP